MTRAKRKLVVVESPYSGEVARNRAYLDRCLLDCIQREEAPFASHGVYPQVLDEHDPRERRLGIECGYAWLAVADIQVFYTDLGWSKGMLDALEHGKTAGVDQRYRALDGRVKFPDYEVEPDAKDNP